MLRSNVLVNYTPALPSGVETTRAIIDYALAWIDKLWSQAPDE